MATLASLGDLALDIVPLEALGFEEEWAFARHAVIEGKPVLQFTGAALRTVELAIRLHHAFTDPAADLAALRALAATHQAQELRYADGTVEGRFVLAKIAHRVLETTPEGRALHMTAQLSLTEDAAETNTSARQPVATGAVSNRAPETDVGADPASVSLTAVIRSGP